MHEWIIALGLTLSTPPIHGGVPSMLKTQRRAPAPRQRKKSSVGDLPAPRSRAAPTRKIQRRRSARAAAAPARKI